MRSDFEEYFLFVKNIKKYPGNGCNPYPIPKGCPVFRKITCQSSEEKFRGGIKIYYPAGKVDCNWIHPDYDKKEGPFPVIPDINNKVEHTE